MFYFKVYHVLSSILLSSSYDCRHKYLLMVPFYVSMIFDYDVNKTNMN